jgi:hypothetical protein
MKTLIVAFRNFTKEPKMAARPLQLMCRRCQGLIKEDSHGSVTIISVMENMSLPGYMRHP